VGNPEGKRLFGSLSCRDEDDIETYFKIMIGDVG
jgi:hypothetical protein